MDKTPFSLEHKWKIKWKRIPSNIRIDPRVNFHNMREKRALKALASLGVITRPQLMKIFYLSYKEVNDLVHNYRIIEHDIIKNDGEPTKIYTLGNKGAMLLEIDSYETNYWFQYTTEDVLKGLLFFQTYLYFPELKVIPTPKPFTGAVQNNDNIIFVYVFKGNPDDLLHYLKFKQQKGHRLILVVENLNQLKPAELFLEDLRVRVVIESELVSNRNINKDIFYAYKDGRLTR